MSPDRFQQIERLVSLGLEHTDSKREELLRDACLGDDELRSEVESLLGFHSKEDGLLTQAPFLLMTDLLDRKTADEVEKPCKTPGSSLVAPGRFKVLDELGVGGMGMVFTAYDVELERKIAIKLARPQASETFSADQARAWLLGEARAMAQISHPNVLAVHDVGTLGEQLFIAMEYVEGTTLSEWLTSQERPWRDVLRMFIQAGRGLGAAHAHGILHRDFKPQNVLVDKTGRARLLDFGLARFADPVGQRSSESGPGPTDVMNTSKNIASMVTSRQAKLVGTLAYMAPEQLTGAQVDERTDQYSYCVALFQGIYGELPFNAQNLGALLEQIRDRRVTAAPNSSPVPSSLRQAILRGLSPERSQRFSSIDALLETLELQLAIPRWRSILDASILLSVVRALFGTRRSERHYEEDALAAVNTLVDAG